MITGKKGMLYLFLAAILLTIFGSLYFITDGFKQSQDETTTTVRAHTINDFIDDLHDDLHRSSYISGFRALLGMEEYLSEQGTFFANKSQMEDAFRQLFVNGTYNGTSPTILDDASFSDYLTRVQQQGSKISVQLTINITNVTLEQTDPWNVFVNFTGHVHLEDPQAKMWWDYTTDFSTLIPIYGLKDPLYTVNTYGRVPNTIQNYTLPPAGFVDGNDTTVLKAFIAGFYYKESTAAPSFIQRFTNDLSPSIDGIESLVYLPALADQDITIKTDRSVVDYIYFSASPNSTNDRCNIQNMIYTPNWFRLDQAHLAAYELDTLTSTGC